jgi:hypothetical protein
MLLHFVNVILFATAVNYVGIDGIKLYALVALFGGIGIALEVLKRKKMAFISNLSLLANCETENDNIRQNAYQEHKRQKPFLVMLWALSCVGVILASAGLARKLTPEIVEAKENPAFVNALNLALANLQKAQEYGSGVGTLKSLQEQVNKAKADIKANQKEVNDFNTANSQQNQNYLFAYMFAGLIVGIFLEALTVATVYALQKKKFEIVQSLANTKKASNFEIMKPAANF